MKTTSCLVLMIAAVLASAGFSQDRPDRNLKGWGTVVNPSKDCEFKPDGNRLTIVVPASKHDLSIEAGDVTAPRVLREIEGDFIDQVKVAGNVVHRGERTSDRYLAYHGAGLLLWQNERNYLRLERAAIVREGDVLHYSNFDVRQDGQHDAPAAEIPDQDTYVRVERKGNRILGATSQDGVHWQYFDAVTVDWPRRIKLGVAAINTSTEAFKAEFSELEIYKREKTEDSVPRQ